jgi:hypothetical protein
MIQEDFLELPSEEQWKQVVTLQQQAADQQKIMWRLFIGNILCIFAVLSFSVRALFFTPTFEFHSKELKDLPENTMLITATGKMNRVTGHFDYLLVVSGADPIAVRSSQSLPAVFTVEQHQSSTRIIDQTQQQEKRQPILGPEI